jgi:hypothetical protein
MRGSRPAHCVVVQRFERVGNLQGESRLAAATRTDECHQPMLAEQYAGLCALALTPMTAVCYTGRLLKFGDRSGGKVSCPS